jgi:sialic acid synthase SpsE
MFLDVIRERCYVIAEIGQNHQGDVEIAKELIRQAKICGAHAVKSQKRDIRSMLTPDEYRRPYNSPHSFGATYGEHREALELTRGEYAELLVFARKMGIELFSSPWDIPSAELLHRLGMRLFKVPSACVTHIPLLRTLASFKKPVLLSTGMSSLDEIDAAAQALGDSLAAVLQCTSAYPCDFNDVNLRSMDTLRRRYGVPVGLSGHHRGIAVDAAAVALGARVIERHFTLDRTMKGSDHAASLEPPGLSRLVRDLQAVEKALGSDEKQVLPCEMPSLEKLRGTKLRQAG